MDLHHRNLGEGTPIFIFHGLFGLNDNWQSFGKALAAHGYSVVLTDLRNHGHSPHSARHDYESMAEDMATLMDKFPGPRLAIGHSMGGKALLKMLDLRRDLVSSAVVVDIAPWFYAPRHQQVLAALQAVELDTLSDRKTAEQVLLRQLNDLETVQFLAKNLFRNSDGRYSWRFNLETLVRDIDGVGESVWPSSPVETPLLFVRGEMSDYLEAGRFDEIRRSYPASVLASVPNAGHWIHAEQPAALFRLISDWFATGKI
jgi:pimeloyl-ACP methyl ester carboxylesterase